MKKNFRNPLKKEYIDATVENEEVVDQEVDSEETENDEEKEEKKMSKKKIGALIGISALALIGGAAALIHKAKSKDDEDFYEEFDDEDDPETDEDDSEDEA